MSMEPEKIPEEDQMANAEQIDKNEESIQVKPDDSAEPPISEEDLLKEDDIRHTIQKRIKQFRRKGGKRMHMYDADEVRKNIEALLFASGRPMKTDELAMLLRLKSEEPVEEQLQELRKDYDARSSPIEVVDDINGWKLGVRERHLPLIARINPNTELSKTLMETLAVVAWKQPILQSEVIRIRTNKAYEHLSQLEEMGFLSREKHGRTQLLRLSQKFFEYFDLQGRKDLQQLFADIQEDAKKEEQKTLTEEKQTSAIDPQTDEKQEIPDVTKEPESVVTEERSESIEDKEANP
jgi:segregation and condensation protein B